MKRPTGLYIGVQDEVMSLSMEISFRFLTFSVPLDSLRLLALLDIYWLQQMPLITFTNFTTTLRPRSRFITLTSASRLREAS